MTYSPPELSPPFNPPPPSSSEKKIRRRMTNPLFYLILIAVISPSSRVQAGASPWGVLSRSNFSSQIRMHPNVLLMVTLPWLGESQSLMKDLADCVASEQEEYGSPKLMILYRNKERMLTDAIGAVDKITIMFYHNSLPFKYQGRLRSRNILASLQYLISHPSENFPIQPLNTQGDLKSFLQSTDKAILLLEFCGWTQQLLANVRNNGMTNGLESNGSLAVQWKKEQEFENEKMTCDAQNGFSGFPWLEELNSVSQSNLNESFRHEVSCSSEKYQQFDTFLTKFMKVAQEFSLPPERLRFGLVANKSLFSTLEHEDASSWLSSLDAVDIDSWLMTVHFSGCPTCSLILREGDDLKSAIDTQNPLVTELRDGGHGPTLPANKPSLLLFIDRSSDSLVARRKGKEAFDAFRSLAFQYHKNKGMDSQFSYATHPQSKSFSDYQNKKLSSASRKIVLKDKVAIGVINERKQVTVDTVASGLQANSLREILTYVLQGGNDVKLSSLAKQAGFQLLSEDFDIKVQEALPTQTKEAPESDQPVKEVLPETNIDLQEDEILNVDDSSLQNDEQQQISYPDKSSQYATIDTSKQPSGEPVDLHDDRGFGKTEEEMDVDEKPPFKGFKGTFFFSDGGYQLLRALIADLKIPSVVMVDPIQQKHYILGGETDFSLSALSDFVNGFANGSLIPYQKSESMVKAPVKAPSPPFVNLDFRVSDSIPQLASDTFTELVIGFNESDNPAWKKDVMVLFSNSWCGFCQRMELAVREVYRVFKHYTAILNVDTFGEMKSRFPQFYFMDCTLNECSLILRSVAQREIYPHLLLFPAESKVAVSYEGDIVVSDIIEFVIDNGNKARDLVKEKGTLWTGVEREDKVGSYEDVEALSERDKHHEVVFEDRIPEDREEGSYEDVEALSERDKHQEVVLEHSIPEDRKEGFLSNVEALSQRNKQHGIVIEDMIPDDRKRDSYFDVESLFQWDEDHEGQLKACNSIYRAASQVGVGSLLIATEKLINVPPFENSVILIINAHVDTGFQGLIINKRVSWNSLEDLEEGLEELKDARLSLGGPLMKEGMPLLALTRENMSNHYPEVLPNIHFLDQLATIHEIEGLQLRKHLLTNYWFFFGYSSWDFDQLFNEINQGAWNVSDAYECINWPWR